MSMEKKDNKITAEVNIFGESLVVVGQSSQEYINSVAKFVNEKLTQLNRNFPRISRNKLIALGTMNLADELLKTKQEMELMREELEKKTKEIQNMQYSLERAQKLAQHYQSQYEELALKIEEE